MWSRREFLKTAAAGMGVLIVPPALLRAGAARAAGTDPVLVTIFLRGGADFLNLVAPVGDPQYRVLRPTIGLAPGAELALDGLFGLHPNLSALRPWYLSGHLAVIHAVGSPSASRSHFDEQDFLERAAPGDKTVQTGWLNRYLLAAGISDPIGAVTLGNQAVKALAGDAATLAIPSILAMDLAGTFPSQRRAALQQIHRAAGGPMAQTVENAFDVYDVLRAVDRNTPVAYPNSPFGAALKDVAALIKADIGVRVAAADLGGWDHHIDEVGRLPGLAGALGASLHAFATDLGTDLGRTAIVVMTEFGRRAAENLSRGTDHGVASAMLVLGGGVAGGRVLLRDGAWPGLTPPQMFEGLDLRVTTDFRDVFAELLARHMGLANLGAIFPGYSPSAANYPGLFV
jgi:uncharacterized protein (DUF1501 family)